MRSPEVSCRPSSFFFQAEDGIRDADVTGVQTCALPIWIVLSVAGKAPRTGGAADHVERGGAVFEELTKQVLIKAKQGHPLRPATGPDQHRKVLLAQAVIE